MKYVPEIDGLRAIAVLAVMFLHASVPGFQAGYIGVDVFFVLSGYLITRILLAEHSATGAIDFRNFYWRRALRLYPAMLLMLMAYLALGNMVAPKYPHGRDALMAGLYLSDYGVPLLHWGKYISHTWSLGVEEKFYLLWPALLVLCLRKFDLKQVASLLILAFLLAFFWRAANQWAGLPTYQRFDTRLPGLIAGCWLGVSVTAGWKVDAQKAAWLGAAVLAYALLTGQRRGGTVIYYTIPLAEIAAIALILGASRLPLKHPILVQLGQLSYGMYLWHPLVLHVIPGSWPWWGKLPFTFLGAVILAWLSFVTVERVRYLSVRRVKLPQGQSDQRDTHTA